MPWQDQIKKSVVKLKWILSSLFYQIPTFTSKMKKKIEIT